jgi:hypothetical protein
MALESIFRREAYSRAEDEMTRTDIAETPWHVASSWPMSSLARDGCGGQGRREVVPAPCGPTAK